MDPFKPVLNAHLIPVGLEIDRAVMPLEKTNVGRIYLLMQKDEPDKIKKYAEQIIARIKEKKIVPEEEIKIAYFGNIDSYPDVMSTICNLAKKEKEAGNKVYINISSGAKLTSIAGTLAASMYDATPYYAVPAHYNTFDMPEPETTGLIEIIPIPTYKIAPPAQEHLEALRIIGEYERCGQINLVEILIDLGLLRDKTEDGKKGLTKQAQHTLFRRQFLEPMKRKGWIETEGKRRGARITLTEKGRDVLQIFKIDV